VTKKEIVKQISDDLGLTQLKTKEIVQKTFQAIIETLISERRIELRNFGVFEVKQRKARKARNPRTGAKVDVPPKFVVTFKPGKEMEERVRQLEEAAVSERAPSPVLAAAAPVPTAATVSNGQGSATAADDGRPRLRAASADEEPQLKVVRADDEPPAKPRRPRRVP
jgi:integration host factor subunit beta